LAHPVYYIQQLYLPAFPLRVSYQVLQYNSLQQLQTASLDTDTS